jgi:glyoxylase-like metal-dependent hydrolase (beta-lactamase superfamily II)
MIRERVADNVYVFTSELYAQLNAGAVVGPEWAVVIDTLAYPEETQELREFVVDRLGVPVRYVINTHYHTDHTLGNRFFPGALFLSHRKCRELLATRGKVALETAQARNRDLRDVRLLMPDVVFEDGQLTIRVGKRTLQLIPLPGHSPDGIGVLVMEDRVLFSGDAMMPVPYLVDGSLDDMISSLKRIPRMKLENLVQGHGEVVLRGEVQNAVRSNLNYLANVRKVAQRAAHRRDGLASLESATVEECGKSRILMNGLAPELHRRNLLALYQSAVEQVSKSRRAKSGGPSKPRSKVRRRSAARPVRRARKALGKRRSIRPARKKR